MDLWEFFQTKSKAFIVTSGVALVVFLWIIDLATGSDFSMIVFYLVPVFLVTWFAGQREGVGISLLSGLAWFSADMITMSPDTHQSIPYLNLITKLGFFLIVNHTLTSLRLSLDRERDMARTDYLTQVANSRYFSELAAAEINRAGRYQHPFTVAYLDIDNFKAVNDEHGHSIGDALLSVAAASIKNNLRSTDVIARLGGDEFALLLPETGYEAAHVVVQKVHLSLLAAMQRNGWPVTFSIGVVTFANPPESVDGMIRVADSFMYQVKHAGKNMVQHKQVEYQSK